MSTAADLFLGPNSATNGQLPPSTPSAKENTKPRHHDVTPKAVAEADMICFSSLRFMASALHVSCSLFILFCGGAFGAAVESWCLQRRCGSRLRLRCSRLTAFDRGVGQCLLSGSKLFVSLILFACNLTHLGQYVRSSCASCFLGDFASLVHDRCCDCVPTNQP